MTSDGVGPCLGRSSKSSRTCVLVGVLSICVDRAGARGPPVVQVLGMFKADSSMTGNGGR